MFRVLFSLLFVTVLAASCRRLPDIQGKGEGFLQGIWNQDSVAHAEKLLSYTLHNFKFTCDSFYVDMVTHSKANYYSDSCFNNGVWKEYAKGTYQVRSDTLFLLGTYTKANYKQKISGCYQIGQYIKRFKVIYAEKDEMIFESIENQRELNLKLKQPITCIPKAL
ncbi:fumarate hydratase [Pedobacter frigoris]|uniref:Fumarate hydratase n=1 Tax=Pedobacter frigoris TaxID=2571272 RepID=A0A4U1C970_9SPHI|nr:fumarate hydratase [Pedobacter frigoris]TKC02926.1 fumarate hydratase [Pedobacter frigoris]